MWILGPRRSYSQRGNLTYTLLVLKRNLVFCSKKVTLDLIGGWSFLPNNFRVHPHILNGAERDVVKGRTQIFSRWKHTFELECCEVYSPLFYLTWWSSRDSRVRKRITSKSVTKTKGALGKSAISLIWTKF